MWDLANLAGVTCLSKAFLELRMVRAAADCSPIAGARSKTAVHGCNSWKTTTNRQSRSLYKVTPAPLGTLDPPPGPRQASQQARCALRTAAWPRRVYDRHPSQPNCLYQAGEKQLLAGLISRQAEPTYMVERGLCYSWCRSAHWSTPSLPFATSCAGNRTQRARSVAWG